MTTHLSVAAHPTVRTTIDITVRLFAAAKAEAGRAEDVWNVPVACTVTDAIDRAGYGSSPVFARSSFLVNGRSATGADVLSSGDTLDVLPPFAGG